MHELPPQAVARIGMRPYQVNLLVRLTLRHPSQTLTDDAANQLREEVYTILHEGPAFQWAAPLAVLHAGGVQDHLNEQRATSST